MQDEAFIESGDGVGLRVCRALRPRVGFGSIGLGLGQKGLGFKHSYLRPGFKKKVDIIAQNPE